MIEQLFQVSTSDAARLAGLDPLVLPSLDMSPKAQLRGLVETFAGTRSLGTLLDAAVQAGKVREALLLGAAATERGLIGTSALEPVEALWRARREDVERTLTAARGTAQSLSRAAPEYQSWARDLQAQIETVELPASMPRMRAEMARFLDQTERLPALRKELEDLGLFAREELDAKQAKVVEAAERAFARLCREISASAFDPQAPAARALWALPSLVLGQRMETLIQLGTASVGLETVELSSPQADARLASREDVSLRSFVAMPGRSDVKLSGASQSLVDRLAGVGRPLASESDLAALEARQAQLQHHHELAALWLSAASATPDDRLRSVALGRGLYWAGRQHLDTHQYRVAAELLKDSFAILSGLTGPSADDALELAGVALIAARLWPKRLSVRPDGQRVAEWLDAPRTMFEWLSEARCLDTLGALWADLESDSSARQLLEISQVHSPNFTLVEMACAGAIATARRLSTDPDRAVARAKLLLRERNPRVDRALEEAALALGGPGSGRSIPAQRSSLQAQAEILRSEAGHFSGAEAPLAEELLGAIATRLDELASSTGEAQEPRLSIVAHLRNLFPEERCDDIHVSLTVRNGEDGKPLGNAAVQLAVLEEAAELGVRLDGKALQAEQALDSLDAGVSRHVAFTLSLPHNAASKVSGIRLRARILSGAKPLHQETFSVVVRPGSRERLKSPFTTGTAVTGENFVGREREMKQLVDALVGDAERVPVVVGVRRIGKTSVLEKLVGEEEILRRWIPVRFDLQDRPASDTAEKFLLYVADRIHESLPQASRAKCHFRREEFREDPYEAFEKFSESIPLVNGRRVLAVFDEFDRIIHLAAASVQAAEAGGPTLGPGKTFQPQVFGAIRKVLMRPVNLRMVFAGLPAIMRATYKDRLFGLFDSVEIDKFTEEEADRVLDAGANAFTLTRASRERLYSATGLQPYLLQLCCHRLFTAMRHSGRDVATLEDVEEVLEYILENESYFTDYVSLVDSERKPLLRALAEAQRDAERLGLEFAPVASVGQAYARLGGRTTPDEIRMQLKAWSEEERPLVRQAMNNLNRFRLEIGLLGEHLLREGVL